MAFRIYIGWDSRIPEPAGVLADSIERHSSIPLDIRFLKLSELDFDRKADPLASTEFTYSRFLVPHLCQFRGVALFLDNDMLCFGDIAEIAALAMGDYALRVVKHDYTPTATTKMNGVPQTVYPRKNWSSMMLMNCERLTLWQKEFVETATGAQLHQFRGIPDELIGEIPDGWNDLDTIDDNTKLTHYTSGGPWYRECEDHPHAAEWLRAREIALQSDRLKTYAAR